ncbi:hypothetical protein QL285_096374 [Trifolium repens]|nr:hypothetical protein QL285_096374 [Trifolium repens]
MDRIDNKKRAVGKPKTRPVKKKNGASSSRAPRNKASGKTRAKNTHAVLSSSSSEDIDEDYAEFLKTYVPEEFYAYGPSPSVDEGSPITVESAAKAPKSSKVKTSK